MATSWTIVEKPESFFLQEDNASYLTFEDSSGFLLIDSEPVTWTTVTKP